MTTKDITYGKTETGTNWIICLDLVAFFLPSTQTYGGLYTPIGGFPTIDVMVYTLFGGSYKLKVKSFTLVFCWVVKCITQYIKNIFYIMSV